MKLKNIFKIILLIILSGFVSSIFVFRELNKDYNYKHTITIKNSYYNSVLYGSGETPELYLYAEFSFDIITDSKKEITNYNQLVSALSTNSTTYGTTDYCVLSGSGYGDNYNNGDHFPIDYIFYVKYEDDSPSIFGFMNISDTDEFIYIPYILVKDGGYNDTNHMFSNLAISDKVSKTNKNISESLNINDINVSLD